MRIKATEERLTSGSVTLDGQVHLLHGDTNQDSVLEHAYFEWRMTRSLALQSDMSAVFGERRSEKRDVLHNRFSLTEKRKE
jgi:hypothetical protein